MLPPRTLTPINYVLPGVIGQVKGFIERYGEDYLENRYFDFVRVQEALKLLYDTFLREEGKPCLVARYAVHAHFPNDSPPGANNPWKVWKRHLGEQMVLTETLLDVRIGLASPLSQQELHIVRVGCVKHAYIFKRSVEHIP